MVEEQGADGCMLEETAPLAASLQARSAQTADPARLLGVGEDTEPSPVLESVTHTERKSQPPFRFDEFGIEEGSVLEFYDVRKREARPDITAVVTGPRSIMCDGETTSLSKKAQELCGLKHGPRGTEYWTWNGRRLVEIYQEKYPAPKKAKGEDK